MDALGSAPSPSGLYPYLDTSLSATSGLLAGPGGPLALDRGPRAGVLFAQSRAVQLLPVKLTLVSFTGKEAET